MPHADSSLVPNSIKTKAEFWVHVHAQLESLLAEEKNWVTNCANASSLIYHSLLAFPIYFGDTSDKAVSWCGVYVESSYFPTPKAASSKNQTSDRLLLASAILVPNVDGYPGHIACDGETKSEIVLPLILKTGETVGVLDLDCLALGGFSEEDKEGLEKIARLISDSSDW